MTSSQWLDLAILAIAFVAAVSGWRSGVLGSVLSFVGVVLGAVAGVLLAPHVVAHIDGNRTKLFVALFLVLGLVVIGEIAGVVLGRAARAAIRNPALRSIDSLGGVALQVVTILLAAWVLAIPFTTSDQPNLAAAVRGSRILTGVDKVAPEWVTRELRASLSKFVDTTGLPDVFPTFGRTPIVNVEVPDASLAADPVVAATRPSADAVSFSVPLPPSRARTITCAPRMSGIRIPGAISWVMKPLRSMKARLSIVTEARPCSGSIFCCSVRLDLSSDRIGLKSP